MIFFWKFILKITKKIFSNVIITLLGGTATDTKYKQEYWDEGPNNLNELFNKK